MRFYKISTKDLDINSKFRRPTNKLKYARSAEKLNNFKKEGISLTDLPSYNHTLDIEKPLVNYYSNSIEVIKRDEPSLSSHLGIIRYRLITPTQTRKSKYSLLAKSKVLRGDNL